MWLDWLSGSPIPLVPEAALCLCTVPRRRSLHSPQRAFWACQLAPSVCIASVRCPPCLCCAALLPLLCHCDAASAVLLLSSQPPPLTPYHPCRPGCQACSSSALARQGAVSPIPGALFRHCWHEPRLPPTPASHAGVITVRSRLQWCCAATAVATLPPPSLRSGLCHCIRRESAVAVCPCP